MITIIVPTSYKDHGNELPRKLAKLAKRLKVESDGGGMKPGGKNYDHFFYAKDEGLAENFRARASKLGFLPFVVNHYRD